MTGNFSRQRVKNSSIDGVFDAYKTGKSALTLHLVSQLGRKAAWQLQ